MLFAIDRCCSAAALLLLVLLSVNNEATIVLRHKLYAQWTLTCAMLSLAWKKSSGLRAARVRRAAACWTRSIRSKAKQFAAPGLSMALTPSASGELSAGRRSFGMLWFEIESTRWAVNTRTHGTPGRLHSRGIRGTRHFAGSTKKMP